MVIFNSPDKPELNLSPAMMTGLLLAVVIGVYFIIVEPLQKKTKQLMQSNQQRNLHINEMTEMVSIIKQQQATKSPMTAKQLLSPWLQTEALKDDGQIIVTKKLTQEQARPLILNLVEHGKVSAVAKDNAVVITFWKSQ